MIPVAADAEQALAMIRSHPDGTVVDVRDEEEYITGHLADAVLLPVDEISAETAAEALPDQSSPDLYYVDTGIPQEFVDYCSQTGCNDIMFTVNVGETIDSDFTPIDAYYVGIGARPAEADEWGLGPSEYDAN